MTDEEQAGELAADLFRLHEAGVTVFPAVALAYAAGATSLHQRRAELDTVAALLQHEAPRAVAELLGVLQDGMGATARACDAAGRALVHVARKYAAADGNTAADFAALVRRRGPDLLVPHETFRPPPGSTDPSFTAAPHGPKDAA